jgi:hypothetical protein
MENPMSNMNRTERLELTKIVRQRAKLAKDDVAAREAQILADAEAALSARFKEDDDAFRDLMVEARAYMAELKAKLDARCAELGIPAEFRPSAELYWFRRGENASKERRSELRMAVRTQAAASGKKAKLEIDRQSVGLQEQLMAGGFESVEATQFLAALPSAEDLMPALQLPAIETDKEKS